MTSRSVLFSPATAWHVTRGEKAKGPLRLDQLASDFAGEATRERWLTVLKKLQAGEMPPKAKPRPPEGEVRALQDPQPLSNLYVSLLQRLGLSLGQFGSSTGSLTGLEAAG